MSNTVPTAFWIIFHVFSDSLVLEEVRRQVKAVATTQESSEAGMTVHTISLQKLKDALILFSTAQEVLRHQATGAGPRMVMEDMFIGHDQYILKKDSVIMIANKSLHLDKEVWGKTADCFFF